MFDKFLSKVGVGAAKVDTVLQASEIVRGNALQGEVRMTGGKTDQEVKKVYLELYTHYTYVNQEGQELSSNFVLHHMDIDEGFTLQAGEEVVYDFELEVPLVTPIAFGPTTVNLKTGLDVSWAFDPKDRDPVQVMADPATERLLIAAQDLGFEHTTESGRCYEMDDLEVPYAQSFYFIQQGGLSRGSQEFEMLIQATPDEAEVMIVIDERRVRFSVGQAEEFGPADLENILQEALAS